MDMHAYIRTQCKHISIASNGHCTTYAYTVLKEGKEWEGWTKDCQSTRTSIIFLQVDVGVVLEQLLHNLCFTSTGGPHKRTAPFLGHHVYLGVVRQQMLDHFHPTWCGVGVGSIEG